jgi:hypothetical protein
MVSCPQFLNWESIWDIKCFPWYAVLWPRNSTHKSRQEITWALMKLIHKFAFIFIVARLLSISVNTLNPVYSKFRGLVKRALQSTVIWGVLTWRKYKSVYIFILVSWLYSPLLALASFSVSWSYLQKVGLLGRGISSSQGLYLNTGQHKHRINTYTHKTSIPCVGFGPTIPASERAKTVHALDCSATVTGIYIYTLNIFSVFK